MPLGGRLHLRKWGGMGDLSSAVWRRSRHCANGSCVEVAYLDTQIAMRDSKHQDGPVLRFTPSEWTAFLDGVRTGDFDPANCERPQNSLAT
jgi:hypothetical protein